MKAIGNLIKAVCRFIKANGHFIKADGRFIKTNGRNGRFINRKRPNGQMSRYRLRMLDFILSRIRSLSAARPSHFYQGLAKPMAVLSWPASFNGRFINANGRLSRPASPSGRFINNGRFLQG